MSKDDLDLPLLNALKQAVLSHNVAFYAPGHKRGRGATDAARDLLGRELFLADLPELPELDNLFAPVGAIAKAQELAAATFGAEQTWFLVNGSTCGIMAAILATCGMGDKIILPRNIHQSAIAGLVLSGAIPVFINPVYDDGEGLAYNLTTEAVAEALRCHPDTKAVMMLHPTYQGICSDLAAIAKVTHEYNIPLLVDEAHGAHFAFHPDLPPSAMSLGADVTIQSTHKTLSALTQASMLHLQGDRVCHHRIARALQLVQSTSPSYILLASLDAAREQIATQGHRLISRTVEIARDARDAISNISNLSVLTPPKQPGSHSCDPTRLTINLSQLGMTGFAADEILHETLRVTCELPLLQHLTFIISLGNTPEDIQKLIESCKSLSQFAQRKFSLPPSLLPPHSSSFIHAGKPFVHPLAISPREAYFAPTKSIALKAAGDRLCGELICPYPPGIPLLMPGETITVETINSLQQILAAGGTITGCKDPTLKTIQVIM